MKRLWLTFKDQLSPAAKIVVIACVILAMILFAVGGGALVSRFKDSAFARRESEREAQRQQLRRERDEALGRAEAAEKHEQELAAQVAINEAIISAAGARAEAAQSKLIEENERYEDEMSAVNQPVDPDERCKRICARLTRLYPDAPCNCR